MKNHNYPIVLGHQYKKGIMALRNGEHGFRFLICRLKKEYPTGTEFELDDIKNIEQEIWFSDRTTLETTIEVMKKALQRWWHCESMLEMQEKKELPGELQAES